MGLQQGLDAIQLIHQAFEQGYQNELQSKKQKQDQALALEANKRANEELDLHRQTTAAQLKAQLAQIEQMHFENKTKLAEMARNGTVPANLSVAPAVGQDAMGNDIPNAQGQAQITTKNPITFGGETLNDYQLPGEVAQQQADQQKLILSQLAPLQIENAVKQRTAELAAEEPFKNKEMARSVAGKIAEGAPEITSREKIAAAAQEAENARAQLAANASITGHKIAADAEMYGAQANNFMLPEQQQQLIEQVPLVAGGGKLPAGKMGEHIQLLLGKNKMQVPDQKDIEKVKAIPMALDTIDKIKDFTKTYGTNSKVQAYLNGKITETDLPTDARAALEAINTRAIPFSKAFEGTQGTRFSVPELKLVINGMVNAGATSKQNKMLSDNLSKVVGLAANSALVRYSTEQRQHILETQGFFEGTPDQSVNGKALDKKTTINNFLKTGKFVPIYN
jgi:hypothetical protein